MTDSDLLAPSEEAIEAAREASAHTAELGMADRLLPRRAMMASLRAAYAVDLAPLSAHIRELEDALRQRDTEFCKALIAHLDPVLIEKVTHTFNEIRSDRAALRGKREE